MTTASVFIGEHDFSNFARVESFRDPIRTINNIVFNKERNFICIDFYAQTFLWHQIRRIISAILKVENKKIEKAQVIEALKNPDKKVDFGLAPAEPLLLKDIVYDFDFEYDEKLLKSLNKLERTIIKNLDVASIKFPKS